MKKMYPSYHYNWPEHGYLLRNDEFLSSAGGWRKISAPLQGSTVGAPNMDENLLTAGIEKINDKIKNMLTHLVNDRPMDQSTLATLYSIRASLEADLKLLKARGASRV
ncbi:MAG: hypothetical protein ABSF86_05880 [Steroidobacteraceae bacterium]